MAQRPEPNSIGTRPVGLQLDDDHLIRGWLGGAEAAPRG
jgi:hypothetical protein